MRFDYKNPQLDQLNLTNKQKLALEYMRAKGSSKKASEALGVNLNSFRTALELIRKKANAHLPDLHDSTVQDAIPDGYQIKGVSNMVENSLGKPMWVKTEKTEIERVKGINQAIEDLCQGLPIRPLIEKIPTSTSKELLNQYTFTDFHIGMLAWWREGGDNWNVDIAKETLKTCFSDMISRAPPADTALINQMGDFLHFDSIVPETPTSGHSLDSDTRPEKMVSAAIECMDFLITEALLHHRKVIVVISQGNHDLYSSIWLRKTFSYMYQNNDRVEFIDSAVPFYAMKWGDVMLAYHHGHKIKFDKLPALMMDQFRELYGSTKQTIIHMGHYHHQEIKEVGTTIVEMHRTLAARDAHASYGGYHSQRASDVITYHKSYGEVSRATVRPLLFGDC